MNVTQIWKLACMLLMFSVAQSALALRITQQPEDAYELRLSEVAFPIASPGTLGLGSCEDCRHASLQLSTSTKFLIGQRLVGYEELLAAVRDARTTGQIASDVGVFVFYDVVTGIVNRLKLKVSTVS